jgi:hypothetical protein
MPITSEPAPSLRPWASATGATPLRTMFNLTCPPKCWVKIGHFYFAGNRTFLLCLDRRCFTKRQVRIKLLIWFVEGKMIV